MPRLLFLPRILLSIERAWPSHQVWLAALLAICLTACGGGGGGGGGDGADTTPPPTPTSSGLVPAAPALGDVLETEASVLRPLADGATWDYHGSLRRLPSDTVITVYSNRRSQRSTAAGFDETESNGANDGESINALRAVGGRIELPSTLALPGRPPEALIGIELRSPVRVGDQYVSFDRRITDVADLDADGRNDAVDAAVYARVTGRETVELPSLPSVQAVRVDITTQLRVRFSRDGSVSPVDVTVQRLWYARGLGIVRAQLEEDNDTYGSRVLAEEWLVAHRRADQQLGPQAGQRAQLGGADVLLPITGGDSFRFQWENDLLWLQRPSFETARWLSLNSEGQVLADRSAAAVDVRGRPLEGRSGVTHVWQPGTGPELELVAFDRQGQRQSAGAVTTDFSERNPLKTVLFRGSVSDGDTVWHAFRTQERVFTGPTTFVEREVLRATQRLTGALASAEIDVGGAPLIMSDMAVAGGVLRQVRGRLETNGSVTLRLLSMTLSPLGTPQWQDLATGLPDTVRSLALRGLADGRMVLVWRGNFESPEFGSEPLSGVIITREGVLVRGSAPSLAAERLRAVPTSMAFEGVRGQRLWFSREETGFMLPGEPRISSFRSYLALDVGATGALADTPARTTRSRPGFLAGTIDASTPLGAPWLLTDRIVWLYRDNSGPGPRLATQVVQLPPAP